MNRARSARTGLERARGTFELEDDVGQGNKALVADVGYQHQSAFRWSAGEAITMGTLVCRLGSKSPRSYSLELSPSRKIVSSNSLAHDYPHRKNAQPKRTLIATQ